MAAAAESLTFAEHVSELRRRLMWSLLFVAIGAGIGYALHSEILRVLQTPLNDSLYYTAPTGAFSFIIKVCVVFGFITALPVVVYQIFAFFGPLLTSHKRRTIVGYVCMSVLLAAAGITFAYFISLPAALQFLTNFGGDSANIQALITADEYFSFVLAYIAGFALLFQLPLVISFINKVTPLKPVQLIGGTRYVILGSFIAAAIITPTPDPLNQGLMAGPIILLYFLSVIVVMFTNAVRHRKQRQPAVVTDVPIAQLDEILADESSLKMPELPQPAIEPTVQSPLPSPSKPLPLRVVKPQQPTLSARQRQVMDMVVPGSRANALQPKAHLRPSQPIVRPVQRPQVRMRIISDFVPVSD